MNNKILSDIKNIYDILPLDMKESKKISFVIKCAFLKYLANNQYVDLTEIVKINLSKKFTFNEIIKNWYGDTIEYFLEESLVLDEKIWNIIVGYIKTSYSFNNLNSIVLGIIYEYLSSIYIKKQKGMFYTPEDIIEHMISLLDIKWNKGKSIMDPACGSGFFLSKIYDNIKDNQCKGENNWDDKDHKSILYKLYGIELDPMGALITKLVLNLKSNKFIPINNIYNEDALFFNIDYHYDYIIGNPPYIGHKLIKKSYGERLHKEYDEVFYDKGDISYCFFKKGIKLLKDEASLAFITSRYFLESLSGKGLRSYIRDNTHIDLIIDFNGNRVIKGAKVDLLIIKLTKNSDENKKVNTYKLAPNIKIDNYKKLFQTKNNHYEEFSIDQSQLKSDGWVLINETAREIIEKILRKSPLKLSNVCNSSQGIITGCDKAFVINKNQGNNYNKDILKPWIKSTDIYKYHINDSDKYLIYTNELEKLDANGELFNQLALYKDKLENRRECKNGLRKWHHLQWGRKKETFEIKKIIFPYKSSNNRFALDEKGHYFSADIYSIVINYNFFSTYSYEFLVCLLNTKLYEFYFKTFGKKLGGALYEYYPNTIMRLQIPEMDIDMDKKSKEYYKNIIGNKNNNTQKEILEDIDNYFYELFNINEEERKLIDKYLEVNNTLKGDTNENN